MIHGEAGALVQMLGRINRVRYWNCVWMWESHKCILGNGTKKRLLPHNLNVHKKTQHRHKQMMKRDSSIPTQQDILCGRCKESFNHNGNRQFRQVLKHYLPTYQGIRTRREISHLFANITRFLVEDMGARFLRKHGLAWIELDFKESKKKVGHAMRDIEAHQQQRAKISKKIEEAQNLPSDFVIRDGKKANRNAVNNLYTIPSNHCTQTFPLVPEICEKPSVECFPELHDLLISHFTGLDAFILSEDIPAPTIHEVIDPSIFDDLDF